MYVITTKTWHYDKASSLNDKNINPDDLSKPRFPYNLTNLSQSTTHTQWFTKLTSSSSTEYVLPGIMRTWCINKFSLSEKNDLSRTNVILTDHFFSKIVVKFESTHLSWAVSGELKGEESLSGGDGCKLVPTESSHTRGPHVRTIKYLQVVKRTTAITNANCLTMIHYMSNVKAIPFETLANTCWCVLHSLQIRTTVNM